MAKRKGKAKGKRKRGKWGLLRVQWKVTYKRRKGSRKPTPERLVLLKKLTLLAALRGEPLPEGCTLKSITWSNPKAGSKGKPKTILNPSPAWLSDYRNGLPTLNRGRWLERRLR